MIMDGLLPLPRAEELIDMAFATAADFDEDKKYPTAVLKSAAGLVHAYYRYAHSEPRNTIADPARPHVPAVSSRPVSSAGNKDAVRAGEEIRGYILTIDADAHEALGSARPSTRTHHEGFGKIVAKLARLYVLTHPGSTTTNQTVSPEVHLQKKHFEKECRKYNSIVRELTTGILRLPPLPNPADT